MKILFICGSLEIGRDGVGDYTRRLSGELVRQGHEATIIALNDHYLTHDKIEEEQRADGTNIQVLRLNATTDFGQRIVESGKLISQFQPDWISLQYVPFAFEKRGIPFGLGSGLKQIGAKYKWHIMFHELWIGAKLPWEIKNKLISIVQKYIILKTIKSLEPAVIHTHLPLYLERLSGLKNSVKSLPLFSNIENVKYVEAPKTLEKYTVGFFSQLEINEEIQRYVSYFEKYAQKKGLKFEVLFIGKNEEAVERKTEAFEYFKSIKDKLNCTGFLDSSEVSRLIQTCNIGITPVPRHALGKSGTVAAFISHGVPVAAPVLHEGYSQTSVGFFSKTLQESILIELEDVNLISVKESALRAKDEISVSNIARKFISDLLS